MRQTISIPDKKLSVIEHLKKQINMSGYIVSLIEKDMKGGEINREEIIKIVQEYIGEKEQNSDLMDTISDLF